MNINANPALAAVENTDYLPWNEAPLPGVERRMLERDGGELARATTIVRYGAGARFDGHVHSQGEEFLVLEGVFSDENGDYGPGMYVRNPPGSQHSPWSEGGCTILVKLRQFADDDQASVRVDTKTAPWSERSPGGVRVMPLHRFEQETVELWDFAIDSHTEPREYERGLELFVLGGAIHDAKGRYAKGTWLRYPRGHEGKFVSTDGARVFCKHGHL